ncbi:MAG: thioredoxin domain-containing protein [Holosporales bacterium]|jgi:protein-disulfide isomerase
MRSSRFLAMLALLSVLTACDNKKADQAAAPAPQAESTAIAEATTPAQAAQPAAEATPYLWSERSLGAIDAPVTVTEYASLGCNHCAHFHTNTLPAIKKKYINTGKVRFIFRDFPLENLSFQAAQLTRCLPESSYFGAISLLFEKQADWQNTSGDLTAVRQLLTLAGLDAAAADACLASEPLKVKMLEIRLNASNELKVESTPTLFVGDTKISGDVGIDALSAALDKALTNAPKDPAQ